MEFFVCNVVLSCLVSVSILWYLHMVLFFFIVFWLWRYSWKSHRIMKSILNFLLFLRLMKSFPFSFIIIIFWKTNSFFACSIIQVTSHLSLVMSLWVFQCYSNLISLSIILSGFWLHVRKRASTMRYGFCEKIIFDIFMISFRLLNFTRMLLSKLL